jgi:hypothetical protein
VSRISSRDPATIRLTARLSRSDVLWVANTAHGAGGHWHARVRGGEPDHDHLASPDAAVRYLADHGVPVPDGSPDAAVLAELAVIRGVVQRSVGPGSDPWLGDGRALLAAAAFQLDPDGGIADARTRGWNAFCGDLLVPLLALVADRAVLRRCANAACRLVFEDGSSNHARKWCDTAGCGNRDRVRRARSRDAGTPAPVNDALSHDASPNDASPNLGTAFPGSQGPDTGPLEQAVRARPRRSRRATHQR